MNADLLNNSCNLSLKNPWKVLEICLSEVVQTMVTDCSAVCRTKTCTIPHVPCKQRRIRASFCPFKTVCPDPHKPQVTQAQNMSIGEHQRFMRKIPIVSVTSENERISIKNSLPYIKCVLHLSCVVNGPIYTVNGFLSPYVRV